MARFSADRELSTAAAGARHCQSDPGRHVTPWLQLVQEFPMAESDDRIIDAMPTKQLFISMLTRDIGLIPAIVDLADNAGDGARRLRGTGSFRDLSIRLQIGPQSFKISDNCGGISISNAKKYAFRFGRDDRSPSIKHSVGQFGVGMKRAIFKLGQDFRVESTTATEHFTVIENVPKWAARPKWTFHFSTLESGLNNPVDKRGTTILVKALHKDVSEAFSLENFKTQLRNELQTRLVELINQGMIISLNGPPIDAAPLTLLSDQQIAPASKKLVYKERGQKTVTVRLFCGLGKSEDRSSAGWHVFCNGRLVLEGDKTAVTGWGSDDDGTRIPGFHGQYNHLRGFAYFDCDDAGRLPWNTTKTGINSDSVIYRAVRLEMMLMMRPVVNFLNKLKDEKQARDADEDAGPLERIVANSNEVPLGKVQSREVFATPHVASGSKRAVSVQRIQYDKPAHEVEAVRKALKVKSYKAVGEKTFDYYYESEID
jgi:hypothetical protein